MRLAPLVALSLALGSCSSKAVDDAAPAAPPSLSASSCDAPSHPFLAPNGASNLHNDAYMTDTYAVAGPTADASVVTASLGGECASVTFDAEGRLVTVCIALDGKKRVLLLAPRTLEVLAAYEDLPVGLSSTSFGAGGYFYLDDQGRAVVATVEQKVLRLAPNVAGKTFDVVETMDLTAGPGALTAADGKIESALPDWAGRVWFVTEAGAVGYYDAAAKGPRTLRLGEKIGNSFAVDETGGVFIVTEQALYRFDVGADGAPAATWRETYDRGTRLKPGQVNFGSGTTPTLMGSGADGWVAITDNAEPRMHVLLYARGKDHAGGRKLCEAAVFEDGASATENSLIGCNRSMVVENNYGYASPTTVVNAGVTSPGVARVDVRADGSGCDVVWTSPEAAPSVVPKLSVASDAVYTYTKTEDGWFFTAIDFPTGKTRFSLPLGGLFSLNNNYAPVTLAKDGTAYVGVIGGLVAIVPR